MSRRPSQQPSRTGVPAQQYVGFNPPNMAPQQYSYPTGVYAPIAHTAVPPYQHPGYPSHPPTRVHPTTQSYYPSQHGHPMQPTHHHTVMPHSIAPPLHVQSQRSQRRHRQQPAINLHTLGEDIVLHLVGFLNYREGIRFTQICRTLRLFSRNWHFWKELVKANQRRGFLLAIPIGADLVAYSAQDLNQLVLRKIRLDRKWWEQRDMPKFAGQLEFNIKNSSLLFHIFSTRVVVMFKNGKVRCWDMHGKRCIAEVRIQDAVHSFPRLLARPQYEQNGNTTTARAVITCFTETDETFAVLVTVQHKIDHNRPEVHLSTRNLGPVEDDVDHGALWVIHKGVIGRVLLEDTVVVSLHSISTGRCMRVHTDIPAHRTTRRTAGLKLGVYADDIYLFHQVDAPGLGLIINRFPAQLVPYDSNVRFGSKDSQIRLECLKDAPKYSALFSGETQHYFYNLDIDPALLPREQDGPHITNMEPEDMILSPITGQMISLFEYVLVDSLDDDTDWNLLWSGYRLFSWDLDEASRSSDHQFAVDSRPREMHGIPALIQPPSRTPIGVSPTGTFVMAAAPRGHADLFLVQCTSQGIKIRQLTKKLVSTRGFESRGVRVADLQLAIDDGQGLVIMYDRQTEDLTLFAYD